jgi:hypothetical protein
MNMADMAEIDKIVSEVNGLDEKGKIIFFQKIEKILDKTENMEEEDVSIESVFGLWKDRDITKETLRQKAWKQN